MIDSILTGYALYTFSSIIVYIGLATLLHLQFGRAGILNFGVVGFFGLGMYSFGILLIKFELSFPVAMLLSVIIVGVMAYGLGKLILDLDSQSVLVATLAFASIIADLSITEKWLTNGVRGLGSVPFAFDFGLYSQFGFFVTVSVITILLIWYAFKLEKSPYGRLLSSIQDNEVLSQSLGKPTSRQKLIFFTLTCALMGLFGALHATNVHFLVPRMLDPGVTFTVWIALILGGRKRVMGGLIGVLATIGIFDFVIETYVPVPASFQSELLPVLKLMLYGLTLMLVIMYRPAGILGNKKLTRS